MLISLTVETSGRGSHALESLTALKIITFRCKFLATMAMGDDDDDNDDDDDVVVAPSDDNEVDGNGATSDDDGYVS